MAYQYHAETSELFRLLGGLTYNSVSGAWTFPGISLLGISQVGCDSIQGGDAVLSIVGQPGVGAVAGGDVEISGGTGDSGASGRTALLAAPSISGTNGYIDIADWQGANAIKITNAATPTVLLARVLEADSGITLNDVGAHGALMVPPGQGYTAALTTTGMVSGTCYALYVGQARYPFTTAKVICNVVTAYVAGGGSPYCVVGIASGDYDAEAAPSLTSRGTLDVSGSWNSTGNPKIDTITVSGITAGMDLWITFGASTTGTMPALRAAVATPVTDGVHVSVAATAPSALSGTAMAASTAANALVKLATRG